jgi:putative salt-induced outer membrane protein YdiY
MPSPNPIREFFNANSRTILLPTLLAALAFFVVAAASAADTVKLANGDILTGDIISRSEQTLVLRHPVLGDLRISTAALHPAPSAETAAAKAETDAEDHLPDTADKGIFASGWLTDWNRQLLIGVSGSSGQSDSQKINVGFTADYEDAAKRWEHKTSYYRNESEGDLSDHSLVMKLNRDFLLPGDRKFYFAGGQFDYDEFKDFDYRLAVNGGMGYELFKSDDWRLLGRAGLGLNRTFGDAREETTAEGLLQLDSKWKINQHQTLGVSNILHPNLSETGEFRNLTTLDWKLKLDDELGFGLVVGLSNEYDSLIADGNKNDFKYHLSVSVSP